MDFQRYRSHTDTKVVLVGDASVGKTSILCQYSAHAIDARIESTIGASFQTKRVETASGRAVNLLLWDTAGQERYRSLIPMYARNAAACVIVVDVTAQSSFESLPFWYDTAKENCPPGCRFYVCANKMDLPAVVEMGMIEAWAVEHRCRLFRTSAMELATVEPMFSDIAEDAAVDGMGQHSEKKELERAENGRSGCC